MKKQGHIDTYTQNMMTLPSAGRVWGRELTPELLRRSAA